MNSKIFIISIALFIIGCSDDDLSHQDVQGRIVSEVSSIGVADVPVLVLSQGSRGSGLFGTTYEIGQQTVFTDTNGNFNAVLPYEDKNNFFTIYVLEQEICTGNIEHRNSFFFEEVTAPDPIEIQVRKFFPLEVTVKNVNPLNENDLISVDFYHRGSNNNIAPLDNIENRGGENQPYIPNTGQIEGLQTLWVGENIDATIFKRVQEGTETKILWTVTRDELVTQFESEFITTIINGVTHFEIEY